MGWKLNNRDERWVLPMCTTVESSAFGPSDRFWRSCRDCATRGSDLELEGQLLGRLCKDFAAFRGCDTCVGHCEPLAPSATSHSKQTSKPFCKCSHLGHCANITRSAGERSLMGAHPCSGSGGLQHRINHTSLRLVPQPLVISSRSSFRKSQ